MPRDRSSDRHLRDSNPRRPRNTHARTPSGVTPVPETEISVIPVSELEIPVSETEIGAECAATSISSGKAKGKIRVSIASKRPSQHTSKQLHEAASSHAAEACISNPPSVLQIAVEEPSQIPSNLTAVANLTPVANLAPTVHLSPIPDIPTSQILLDWYGRAARTLPWRGAQDPYQVWLSETILQQTTVAAAGARYIAFLARFPTLHALAAAPRDDVLDAWAGLGYYARARNLHAAAQAVVALGHWPTTPEGLQALPGIGPYTARAVAAIAFGLPVMGVDTNVARVVSRIYGLDVRATRVVQAHADALAHTRPSDIQQAVFDLGARICRPKAPECGVCPLRAGCVAYASGTPELYAPPVQRAHKPHWRGHAYAAFDPKGWVLLQRRPDTGLLGGMLGLPGAAWGPNPVQTPPLPADWMLNGTIVHVFAHFRLELDIWSAQVSEETAASMTGSGWVWAAPDPSLLPTVMAKALERALGSRQLPLQLVP